jgi:CheY-like chemotaxis protein
MKILIVDDIQMNIMVIKQYLINEFEFDVASNGEEALSKIETFKPDLILMDIMMPVMDGITALRIIRKKDFTSKIPVIVITSKNTPDDIKDALKAGASDYITKPIDRIELLTKINIQKQIIDNVVEIHEYKAFANIQKSMYVAQRFQQSLLPDKITRENAFPESFVLNFPKNIVSGDFYSIHFSPSTTILSLYDCMGHGVPAAMMSLVVHLTASKHLNAMNNLTLKQVVENIDAELITMSNQSNDTHFDFGFDAIFLEIDRQKMLVNFIGINRPLFVIRKDVSTIEIDGKEENPYLSFNQYYLFYIDGSDNSIEGTHKIVNKTIKILQNDCMYLFSDGFPDQLSRKFNEDKVSINGLAFLLLQNQNKSMNEQSNVIFQYINSNLISSIQLDDILLLGIKV